MTRRRRPATLVVLAFFTAFALGPLLGMALARFLAPASFIADAVGMFAFPLAFAAGIQTWLGLAIFSAAFQLVRRLRAGEPWRQQVPPDAIPPGSVAFLPISIVAGALSGLIIGIASESSVLLGSVLFVAAGALYGFVLWRLAASGYLPFPDHE